MQLNGEAKLRPVSRPKAVALVGFGHSMHLMHDLPPGLEVWTLNAVEKYDFPRIDRAFELHPIRDIVLETPRWERLQKPLPYPTYMLEADERIPSSVTYPRQAVSDAVFQNIHLGNEQAEYFDSTFPYMLALAVFEGYRVIFVMGFEFQSDTEYRYQRPGAALLIGWAAGKGAQIVLPPDSELLPRTLYGYEDYQMISRQNLEQFLADLINQQNEWQSLFNVANTRCMEREALINRSNGDLSEEVKAEITGELQVAMDDRLRAWKEMYMRSGAVQVVNTLIAICDRKEAKLTDEGFEDQYVLRRDSRIGGDLDSVT